MSKLVLLNDVSTEVDEANLFVGDADPPDSEKGKEQANVISSFFLGKVNDIDLILSSDAQRIKKLVHRIRADSKDQNLTSLTPRRVAALRERSFGVLNRTPYSLDSDIFRHTRIKPEKGESIFECRVRIMKYIVDVVENWRPDDAGVGATGDSAWIRGHRIVRHQQPRWFASSDDCGGKTVLLVSHPFVCQIAFNAILQRDHTLVTDFWTRKGSFVVLGFEFGQYGVRWKFDHAYNALSDTSYTQNEIYSGVLGKEGSLSC